MLSFLSYVYLRKENWEGFADVFEGLATLAGQNYDALFPDRERAKQMAFKWLSEDRYNDTLNQFKPGEAHYEHMTRLAAALAKIKPILESKFPEGSPFPAAIYKNVQIWEKALKPKPVAPPPAAPSAAPGTSSAAGQGTASASVSAAAPGAAAGASEPMDTPRQAQSIGRRAALFLIEKEPVKPMGYRLLRSLRWDIMEKSPPADSGKTQLPAPAPQQRSYFQNLIAQKDWKTALDKAEAAFSSGANHLWLDLQRISATACKEMGDTYSAVRQAIVIETAFLLRRVPDLPSLSFTDGSAFCDDATKDWLGQEVQNALSGNGGPVVTKVAGDAVGEDTQKANALLAAGQLEEALDFIQVRIRTSAGERDNFRRTILVGSLLLKAKQPDIAISVLESLDQKITAYSLDRWEPDLAVDAWTALVQAYKAGKGQKAQNIQMVIQDKQNTILSKISQIDPRKAFTLNK